MKKEEIKSQMMRLWKETFHDSDNYIKLVFDTYFDIENIEYEEREGIIIASLLAIPYEFGNDNYTITGVYLCGLSTKEKYRGNGIMTSLIQNIENKMRLRGYSFMFLIPADKGLNRYYLDRGFINGFYKTYLHYTSVHDFKRDFFSTISKEEESLFRVKKNYFEGLSIEEINEISALQENYISSKLVEFITDCQKKQKGLTLYQNKQQISIFLREIILSGGRILICRNVDNEVAGVALYSVSNSELREVGRYSSNYGVLCKLREAALLLGGGRNLSIIEYGYENNKQAAEVWNPMFGSFLPSDPEVASTATIERIYNPASHSEVYGMVRILSISEILIFLCNWRRDLKFSILVRQENDGKIYNYILKNGQLSIQEITDYESAGESNSNLGSENKNRKIVHIRDSAGIKMGVLSEKDLGEILFRRSGAGRLIEEAFGLPALNGKISLLLD